MTDIARAPEQAASAATRPRALATEVPRGRTQAWWGMVLFITTEATLFACLLASYFYIRFSVSDVWPPDGIKEPELRKPLIMTVILLASSGPMIWADFAIKKNHKLQLGIGLTTTWILGAVFLGFQTTEYLTKIKELTWDENVYGSLFYVITGFHGIHVITGLLMVGFAIAGVLRGKYTARRHERIRIVGFYWHFIDIVWIFILFTIYLSPRL